MNEEKYSSYPYYNPLPSPANYPISNSAEPWNNWNAEQQNLGSYNRKSAPPYTSSNHSHNSPNHNSASHNSLPHNSLGHSPVNHKSFGHNSHNHNSISPLNHKSLGHNPPNHNSYNHNSYSQSSPTNSYGNYRPPNYYNYPPLGRLNYYRNRYNNGSMNHYNDNQGQGWQRNQNNCKRARQDSTENEPQLKTTKKKKKPLSQNIPAKREWNIEEAEMALATEKEHNKKSKNALIIKFPDQELNKEIVGQFHPLISNVHFQQPCTPRFCFVTLQESANSDEVIETLNKKTFGNGFLTVEYKKDREEDQAISAEDIDPHTLYIGNLAQEVTKEDMVTMYPKCKRIDIGFAKKMKYTRYAFIGFRSVTDSIEAFKNTHNKQMYNKSLIVRFRRLHGTVGMPGETKPQMPNKSKDETPVITNPATVPVTSSENSTTIPDNQITNTTTAPIDIPVSIPQEEDDIITTSGDYISVADVLSVNNIKHEELSDGSEDDTKLVAPEYMSNADEYWNHTPMIKTETGVPVKKERSSSTFQCTPVVNCKTEDLQDIKVKNEPADYNNDYCDWLDSDDEDDMNDAAPSATTDFDALFENMKSYSNKICSLKNNGI